MWRISFEKVPEFCEGFQKNLFVVLAQLLITTLELRRPFFWLGDLF